MSQNIRRYLQEKYLIIYLLCIFVNFNLKTLMPNVFCQQLETGLTSLTVKVVKLVFQTIIMSRETSAHSKFGLP